MTATQRFIEKAIQGGWDVWEFVASEYGYLEEELSKDATPMKVFLTDLAKVKLALLDPEAWKAVGKVERWRDDEHESTHSFRDRSGSLTRLLYGWEYRWHEMLHALEEGKSIESYLETIV